MRCPYCRSLVGVDHDEDCEKKDLYEATCSACGKHFVYIEMHTVTYESYKADCLNGGPHLWRPNRDFPHRLTCRDCGRTARVVSDDGDEG